MAGTLQPISVANVVFEEGLYPRIKGLDHLNVKKMVAALGMGMVLPPIRVVAGNRWLIDGRHRTEAYRIHGGPTQLIPAIHENISDLGEIFAAAAEANSHHGLSLSQYDLSYCIIRGRQLGVTDMALMRALSVSRERFAVLANLSAFNEAGQAIPVKASMRSLAGQVLNPARERALSEATHSLERLCRQVLSQLRADAVEWSNTKVVHMLAQLRDELVARVPEDAHGPEAML